MKLPAIFYKKEMIPVLVPTLMLLIGTVFGFGFGYIIGIMEKVAR